MLLRRALPDEWTTLQAIDLSARRRYSQLAEHAGAAAAPPIAADRLAQGSVTVADVAGVARGFTLVQPIDGMLYLACIAVEDGFSGCGLGRALVATALGRARRLCHAGLVLATFREPAWNGPWFRDMGFSPLPDDKIGPGLAGVLARHATFLDMSMRETLWQPVRAPHRLGPT